MKRLTCPNCKNDSKFTNIKMIDNKVKAKCCACGEKVKDTDVTIIGAGNVTVEGNSITFTGSGFFNSNN